MSKQPTTRAGWEKKWKGTEAAGYPEDVKACLMKDKPTLEDVTKVFFHEMLRTPSNADYYFPMVKVPNDR